MGMMGFKMHPIASVNGKCSTKLPKFLVHCGPDPLIYIIFALLVSRFTPMICFLFDCIYSAFSSCTFHFYRSCAGFILHIHRFSIRLTIYVGLFLSFIMPHLRDKHTLLRTTQLLRCVRKGFWSKHRKRLTAPKTYRICFLPTSIILRSGCVSAM